MTKLPSQTAMMLPLLNELATNGPQTPSELYDKLAKELGLDDETRNATIRIGNRNVSPYERAVRWTRQTAVARNLINKDKRGIWDLTDAGNTALRNARRGVIVTVFESEAGILLWANVEDAVSVIDKQSIQSIVTSPPYPLNKQKAYGNLDSKRWLDWMLGLAEGWRELLTNDGSLFLNLGPVWTAGQPTQDPYIERLTIAMIDKLGYHLAQRLEWHSPSRLPQPIEYVCVKRVRLKPTIETILWFSPTPNPKADNARILVPYSDAMKRTIANGQAAAKRPSGAWISPAFGKDNGGAIAPNLFTAANAASNDAYHRACRESELTPHPATFPITIPEKLIAFTTDPGDIVMDPFAGSGTTCEAALKLDRKFIGIERSHTYLEGALTRLATAA